MKTFPWWFGACVVAALLIFAVVVVEGVPPPKFGRVVFTFHTDAAIIDIDREIAWGTVDTAKAGHRMDRSGSIIGIAGGCDLIAAGANITLGVRLNGLLTDELSVVIDTSGPIGPRSGFTTQSPDIDIVVAGDRVRCYLDLSGGTYTDCSCTVTIAHDS